MSEMTTKIPFGGLTFFVIFLSGVGFLDLLVRVRESVLNVLVLISAHYYLRRQTEVSFTYAIFINAPKIFFLKTVPPQKRRP